MSRYFKVSWAYLRKLAYLALLIRKKAAPYLFTRFQKACGKNNNFGNGPKMEALSSWIVFPTLSGEGIQVY
jgi:hypothetical protein